MAEDPNESARRAFGDAPSMPPPPPPVSAPVESAQPASSAGALATWGTRAMAFVLDGLFVFGVAFALTLGVAFALGDTDEAAVEVIAYAVGIPLGLLYSPLLMARRGRANGQTFGKQMMDIRVVRMDGERVTFVNAFLRQIVYQQLLIAFTLYIYAVFDYLWPLRDARNQALHDKMAGTLVVRTAPSAALPQPARESVAPPPSPRDVDEAPIRGWLPPSPGD